MELKEYLEEEVKEIDHMINILLSMDNYIQYVWLVAKLRTSKRNIKHIIAKYDP